MDDIKKLDKHHRETEINFKISSFWDGPIHFYFGLMRTPDGESWTDDACFEKFEDGVRWLIERYEAVQ